MLHLHAAYDDYWPVAFVQEAERLKLALGNLALRIDHVGSTSLRGIISKPVIDIQISVTTLTPLEPLVRRLATLNYTHFLLPEPPVTEYPFFHRPSDWPQAFQVHLCKTGGVEEWRHLAFRDWLRTHPDDRVAYAHFKMRLARGLDPADPQALLLYSRRKGEFVREIERKAREQDQETLRRW